MEWFVPTSWDEFVGNKRAVKLLKGAFRSGIKSIIIYGPVGVGKTTAALLLAKESDLLFFQIDGSRFSKPELERILRFGNNVLLFIDEITRLNRNAQHMLLNPIQEGRIVLIGASWENPWKVLIPPLRSRSVLVEFKPLTFEELKHAAKMIASKWKIDVPDDVLSMIAKAAGGDIRRLQNILTLWSTTGELDDSVVFDGVSNKDEFYDVISAMIKSIRGSDPDASVYYLIRFIEEGGAPEYVARRLVILASEDIGNADPYALTLATSAMYAVSNIGMPEALYFLVQTAMYLAAAPKSNSTVETISRVREVIEQYGKLPVPRHLKNIPGSGYKYPHSYGGWVNQKYLPKDIDGISLVKFKSGYEKKMLQRIKAMRKDQGSSGKESHQGA